MDLAQLANLGEFIGGIAVLATLVYLALQVKQSRDVGVAVARQQTTAMFQSTWDRVAQAPEMFSAGTGGLRQSE